MSLIASYDLTTDQDFRNKVLVAMTLAATQVVGEALTAGKNTLRDKRHQLGVAVLSSPSQYLPSFLYAVVSNGILNLASTDGDIQFTVNSVYNDIAGVKIEEA